MEEVAPRMGSSRQIIARGEVSCQLRVKNPSSVNKILCEIPYIEALLL